MEIVHSYERAILIWNRFKVDEVGNVYVQQLVLSDIQNMVELIGLMERAKQNMLAPGERIFAYRENLAENLARAREDEG